ncbi:PREDICTED: uncharacterized protein LOC104708301 [Camelina sativa]|uniref:Uncharacterized protein LOC104708301 n=1 Tax=Camelina sativa TaxID=90675 RepID=A0ABM0TA40_CAMSA|nr:PREDICTED: uncharacterized protein LOC104708301 [Camelina sativa]
MVNLIEEPCQVCGDVGVKDYIMTCFSCRKVREHIYCARVCLRSVPHIWLCEVCRSPARVSQISNLKDNSSSNVKEEISTPVPQRSTSDGGPIIHQPLHGLMLLSHSCPDKASLVSTDTSLIKKHRPKVLDFPSPKRKRRTVRLAEEDIGKTKLQRPQSPHSCAFHRID